VKPLNQACGVEDSIAAALEHLDLVIEPLDKPTALAVEEVVRDLVEALVQGREEAIKAGQATRFDEARPGIEVVAGLRLGQRSIEDEAEHLAQQMGCFEAQGHAQTAD
jgi:N-dimethylarginine dimethylaminohydrolase